MQQLLDKAVGQRYGNDDLITRQTIGGDSFIFRYTVVAYDKNMDLDFTGIQWAGGFKYTSSVSGDNPALQIFVLEFEKDLHFIMRSRTTSVIYDGYRKQKMKLYVLVKDAEEMNELLKQ
ncbi:MAG TPA: hypothetical protein VGO58_14130 [Chitinophagaceae bacterium]|jgi:hypothetical protein|nr:hypothetical protein [Chitinophagaceae bacterium]